MGVIRGDTVTTAHLSFLGKCRADRFAESVLCLPNLVTCEGYEAPRTPTSACMRAFLQTIHGLISKKVPIILRSSLPILNPKPIPGVEGQVTPGGGDSEVLD